jgi:SAM-dependent methyltransferase
MYGDRVAQHYQAYRPPLHELILQRVLGSETRFEVGLDIGCGTGRSTLALKPYCDTVHGVDPSDSMLSRAPSCEGVTYIHGTVDRLPAGLCAGVVTFAGCLYYARHDRLVQNLRKICQPDALVIVYDFEVNLEPYLNRLDIPIDPLVDYDHSVNFGQDSELDEIMVEVQEVETTMSSWELTQVLLSCQHRYARIVERFGETTSIEDALGAGPHEVSSAIWYSSYRWL